MKGSLTILILMVGFLVVGMIAKEETKPEHAKFYKYSMLTMFAFVYILIAILGWKP